VAADNNNSPVFEGELRIAEHFPRPLFEDWEDLARRSLGSRTLESLTRTTHEGLDIAPLYAAEDLPPSRITIQTPPRETWQTCFPVDLREPETAISQAIEGLSHGGTSLWAKVDRRKSTWGRLTVGAMTRLLEVAGGAPVYLDGRGATPALAALVAAAEGRLGSAAGGIQGAFDHDPIGTLAADGALPWSLETSFALMAGMVRWTEEHAPEVRAIAVSTLPHAKAGATAVDELALAIATSVEYLRRLEAAGIAPEVVCRRLRFILPVGRDFFMEIAKLRAVRWLWARVAEACGVAPDARAVPVHAITSPRCLTVRDPWVNILRGTVESFAAVVGGADALTVLPFDSAAGQSDKLGRRLAVNTQTNLREESGLDRVEDPAAGSYFVERLTHDLAAAAWDRFRHIEASEGMASYLLSGAVARELGEASFRKRHAVSTRRDLVTGVSSFPNLDEDPLLRKRVGRDDRRLPDDVETAVHRPPNADTLTFAAAVAAAAEGVSARELVEMFAGDGQPELITAAAAGREARPFEQLRAASDRHLRRVGTRPRAFLAVVGPPSEYRATAAYVADLLATGGITAIHGPPVDGPEDTVEAFASGGSRTVVIVAAPERAAEVVPLMAEALKEWGTRRILVAARPDENQSAWRTAGVDGYVYPGCDAVALLGDILEVEGVGRG
jgi:methylmalonyl-CoA mutase